MGRAVAAHAADPNVKQKSGQVFSSWDLSDEYGFTDADGSRPHWSRHFTETYGAYLKFDDALYRLFPGPGALVLPDWP